VLCPGRRCCELKLAELTALARGIDYASAGIAIKRFEQRLKNDKVLRDPFNRFNPSNSFNHFNRFNHLIV